MTQEALKLALEALMRSRKAVSGNLILAGCAYGKNDLDGHKYSDAKKALVTLDKALTAIKEALAQPEPCDMGDICIGCSPRNADGSCPSSQRKFVGLTGEEAMDVTRKEGHELLDFIYEYGTGSEGVEERIVAICKAIEAKLKQKNGYAEEKNT